MYPPYRKQYKDVLALVERGGIETYRREYKRQICLTTSDEKRGLLESVTAMANTLGGEIIFGVNEKAEGSYEVVGLDIENIDKLKQSFESILRDSIEPRIRYYLDIITDDGKSPLAILYIDKTYDSPHRIIDPKHHPFYKRDASGKHPMDIKEIRASFLESDNYVTRVDRFLDSRYINVINELEVSTPWMSIHVIPNSSLDGEYDLTTEVLEKMIITPINSRGCDHRIILDGVSFYQSGSEGYFNRPSYVQIFRNGIVESYSSDVIGEKQQEGLFHLEYWESRILDHLVSIIDVLTKNQVIGPYFISIAFNGMKHSRVVTHSRIYGDHVCDRDFLKLPLLYLNDIEMDINAVLKDHIGIIRSAFGMR